MIRRRRHEASDRICSALVALRVSKTPPARLLMRWLHRRMVYEWLRPDGTWERIG